MPTPDDFVELGRTFSDFQTGLEREEAAYSSYLAAFVGGGTTWEDLLKSRCVAILAEAGSGKTWELRARAKAIEEAGQRAFFVRLETLTAKSLPDSLAPNAADRFRKWQVGKENAVFFLDAVDEAKLTSRNAFENALRSFAAGLGKATLSDARIVISSRVTGWRSQQDRFLLSDILDLSLNERRDEDKPPSFRVVTMDPLSRDQVETFARHHLSKDTASFLKAVDENDAWTFARRPIDVLRLAQYWQENKTLGTLTEILEHDVKSRLSEVDEDRRYASGLSDSIVRDGAEVLAGAVALGKTFPISLESEPREAGDPAYVVPSAELPNWQPKERRDLLSRALFDPATFGAVRFHHRGVSEYLAAKWLDRLLQRGLPLPDCLNQLFARSHGEDLLIPSRTAIACWLACGDQPWNLRIRGRLIDIEPEILLSHGDGATFDVATRRKILRRIAARISQDPWRDWNVENEQLRRLAHPDLVFEISELILKHETSEEALILLLRLVREGNLDGCVPAIRRCLESSTMSDRTLRYAIGAIGRAGTHDDKRRLVDWVLDKAESSETIACEVLTTLYPDIVTATEFVQLTEKVRRCDRMSFPDYRYVATGLLQDVSPARHLGPILQGLIALLQRRPGVTAAGQDKCHLISQDYLWLSAVLRAAVARALALPMMNTEIMERSILALRMIELADEVRKRDEIDRRKIDLQKLSLAHPALRQSFFWQKASELAARRPGEAIECHRVAEYYSPLKFAKGDLSWVLEDLSNGHPETHRETALRWASDISWECGQTREIRNEAWRRIRDSRALKRLHRELFPGVTTRWYRRGKWKLRNYMKWGHKEHLREIRKIYWRTRNRIWFRFHLRGLREGRYTNALIYLYESSERRGSDDRKFRLANIASEYGIRIAGAYRQGCKAYWRTFSPPLSHEKDDPTKTAWGVLIGLEGLWLAFDDGLDPAAFTPQEAVIAARYATEELNGFPEWLPLLAACHPEPVRMVFAACVTYDWTNTAEGSGSHVMGRLARSVPSLAGLVTNDMYALLRNKNPGSPELLLEAVLMILRNSAVVENAIADLASRRVQPLAVDSPILIPWLLIWLWLDVMTALDWLEGLEKCQSQDQIDRLFLEIGDWLEDRRLEPIVANSINNSPEALRRLTSLFYKHVRPEEDIDRAGTGVYSPDTRDHAQGVRNRLLDHLSTLPGTDAHNALVSLAENPEMVRHRAYLLRLAASRRRQDAEPDQWLPGDARKFADQFLAPIRSGHDLFSVTIRRFVSLKDELEDADFRRREGLPTDGDEDRLQEWLALYLDERSDDQYVVQREVMVACGKKPDLRAEIPSHSPTSIEVKWADDWSYNDLSAALSDQLVGRYMRARRSQFGVLFLGWRGKKGHWRCPTGERVDFSDLLVQLEAEATNIQAGRWDINGLRVLGARFAA